MQGSFSFLAGNHGRWRLANALFLSGKEFEDMKHEDKKVSSKKPVQVSVTHEFVGIQSLAQAFTPVIYEDIRKQVEEIQNRTLDNEVGSS